MWNPFTKKKKQKEEDAFPSRSWEGWLKIPLIGSFIHTSKFEKIPVIGWFAKGAEKAAFMSRILILGMFAIALAVLYYLFKRPKTALKTGEKGAKGIGKMISDLVSMKKGGK